MWRRVRLWKCRIALLIAALVPLSNAHAQTVNPALDGKIVYWSDTPTGTIDSIYSVNRDSSGAIKLFDKSIDPQHYAISADGNVFAYRKSEGEGKEHKFDIWTMSADGANEIKLTEDGRWNGYPSLDSHGRKVAFIAHTDGTSQAYVMNADGSGLTKLTESPLTVVGSPVLSPRGDLVVVQATTREWHGDTRKWHFLWTLFLVTTDGKTGVQLTATRDSLEGTDSQPAFSRDGQRIVFTSKRNGVLPDVPSHQWTSDIYVVNRDGSKETRLTDLKGFCSSPRFSPDGGHIVFQRTDKDKPNAKSEIWTMKADGSDFRCIVKGDTDYQMPYWIGLPAAE